MILSGGCWKCVEMLVYQFSDETTSGRGREVDLKIFEENIFGSKMGYDSVQPGEVTEASPMGSIGRAPWWGFTEGGYQWGY